MYQYVCVLALYDKDVTLPKENCKTMLQVSTLRKGFKLNYVCYFILQTLFLKG